MTFGEKLFTLRRQAGYSQEDLAALLGVSRQAISRWEMGATLPDAQNLLQLSRLFSVSIDSMLQDGAEVAAPGQPAMESAAEQSGKEAQNRRIAFGALMGMYAAALCLGLTGWIVTQRTLATLLPMTIHIVGTVVFETVWRTHGGILPEWRRRYYRSAIWMMAWFPCWHGSRVLWHLYPGSYNIIFPMLTTAAMYVAVCLLVRHRFRTEE